MVEFFQGALKKPALNSIYHKISSGKSTTMGRSTRTVMGDLGNNAAGSNRAGLRAKDNNAPVQKPGRTLAKQKVISVPSNN